MASMPVMRSPTASQRSLVCFRPAATASTALLERSFQLVHAFQKLPARVQARARNCRFEALEFLTECGPVARPI